EHWLAFSAGRPVGWIQCYATVSYPEESEVQNWWKLGVHRSAGGIDYLIGDPAERGRGTGSAMIDAFVRDVAFKLHPEWTQICASPQAANVASCRALARAGFRPGGQFVDEDTGLCQLM